METFRQYGSYPYKVVLIHGGPGVPGYMKPVAEELVNVCGVLEPFQSAGSIDGQIEELRIIIKSNCAVPVTLVGHSWGAWLSAIFASEIPDYVKKLILVSSGPFDDEYSNLINETRYQRLSEKDVIELNKLKLELNSIDVLNKKEIFKRFGELSSKADYFKPISFDDYIIDYQPEIFHTIMREALYLRKSGKLLRIAGRIKCPVLLVHGDYDPHPYIGVKEPLSGVIENIQYELIKNCGHYPWNEKEAKDKFFEIIKREL